MKKQELSIIYKSILYKVIVATIVTSMMFTFWLNAGEGHIERDRLRWKPMYKDVTPGQSVNRWLVPFKTTDRKNIKTIAVVSVFGAKRLSYVRGHFHTGLDMIPRKRQGKHTYVYAMAAGTVCSIHLGHPHKTVVVKHKLPEGGTVFTSYKHLQETYLETGQKVSADTKIGRLYTRAEARRLGGNYHHLHLEIRKAFDDYGVASWATIKKSELNKRFYDPHRFMKENVR